jgi:hypothetical protein
MAGLGWTKEQFDAVLQRDDRRHRRGDGWKFANVYRCEACGSDYRWYKAYKCPHCHSTDVVLVGPAERDDMAAKKKGGIGASAPPKSKQEPKPARELKQPDRAVIVLDGEIGKAIRKEATRRDVSLTALGKLMWEAYVPTATPT